MFGSPACSSNAHDDREKACSSSLCQVVEQQRRNAERCCGAAVRERRRRPTDTALPVPVLTYSRIRNCGDNHLARALRANAADDSSWRCRCGRLVGVLA